ncbi:MAG: hypothetical protein NVS4B6_25040 [Mycobacterium sp.]
MRWSSGPGVAPGAQVAEANQLAATGVVIVLSFTDGRWQSTPILQPPAPCSVGTTQADRRTFTWSLRPQKDGTLRGLETITVLTGECGFEGNVYDTPILATRINDVPSSIIVADPALFE